MMKNKDTHISWQLFRKAVHSGLNAEEQRLLEAWLQADAKRQAYFEKAQNYYREAEKEDSEYDYQSAFYQFVAQTKPKRKTFFSWMQVVASIAVLVAGAWVVYLLDEAYNDYKRLSESQFIHAKEGEVELILSSGKKVLLKPEGKAQIQEESGKIQKKTGEINYLAFNDIQSTKTTKYNTVNVPRGTKFKLLLSDSTEVYLNALSEISYPLQFKGNKREVSIKGEAYFKVAKNSKKTFVVKTKEATIKVLGTAFNVNAYKENDAVFTSLEEGSLAVSNQFGKSVVIKPGEQAQTGKQVNIQVKKVDMNQVLSWRNGIFDFEDEDLSKIMDNLVRWYDFKVFYESEELKTYKFTGTINRYDDVGALLQLFEMTKSVEFYVKGNLLLVKKKEIH